MPITMTPSTRIMHVILRQNDCPLEDVVRECSDLTWNQVFLELDRLSREGKVRLRLRKRGHYTVNFVAEKEGVV